MRQWLLSHSRQSLATTGILGAFGLWVPMVWTAASVDMALGAAGLVWGAGAGWAYLQRKQLDELPLCLSPNVGTGTLHREGVWRFRAQLGQGRALHHGEATITVDGVEQVVRAPISPLVGPWTICVRGEAPTAVDVRVQGTSAGQVWRCQRSYAPEDFQPGRFVHGALVFSPRWTELEDRDAGWVPR